MNAQKDKNKTAAIAIGKAMIKACQRKHFHFHKPFICRRSALCRIYSSNPTTNRCSIQVNMYSKLYLSEIVC